MPQGAPPQAAAAQAVNNPIPLQQIADLDHDVNDVNEAAAHFLQQAAFLEQAAQQLVQAAQAHAQPPAAPV